MKIRIYEQKIANKFGNQQSMLYHSLLDLAGVLDSHAAVLVGEAEEVVVAGDGAEPEAVGRGLGVDNGGRGGEVGPDGGVLVIPAAEDGAEHEAVLQPPRQPDLATSELGGGQVGGQVIRGEVVASVSQTSDYL